MPTTGVRPEDELVDLFLSVYEDRSWAGSLSTRTSPERITDGGVEMLATRVCDGRTLAIEHTLIEPFVGEKTDFHTHFKRLAEELRADESLKVPGFALYVNAPINILPRGADWPGIIGDVSAWIRATRASFPSKAVLRDCPSPNHPDRKVTLQVRLQPLNDPSRKFLIVQRYGEMRVGDSVEKALQRKLPKLVTTVADKRLLMLEREQAWVYPENVCAEVERLQPQFPSLAAVQEIWIADTASFSDKKEYVDFQRYEGGSAIESFAFYRGKLESIAKRGAVIYSDSSVLSDQAP